MAWNPYGVSLELFASASRITRISATHYTADITASWETYYSGAYTTYGMRASSGGKSITLNNFNPLGNRSGGSTFTGTYSISGNASAQKTIAVTFTNFSDTGASKSTTVNITVTVPAWTSYTVSYNANGGTNAPSSQTKWKDQALTLSSSKPTRTGYDFKGWATSASGSVAYAAGASYTANASVTLYAVWKANAYTVSYNANGGTGAPGVQTKNHGTALTLSSTKPTRTNYKFLGWATTASATTAQYAAGANYTENAAVTLYAVWELDYFKPAIYNLAVARYDGVDMVESDTGTTAMIWLDWKTTNANPTIRFECEAIGYSETRPQQGTSGSVEEWADENFDPEKTYTIKVTVADSGGETSATITLSGISYPIDVKAGGDGVSFGKPAELGKAASLGGTGVADFNYDGKFNKPVYGKALGMDRLPAIPANSDLNDYMETGCYAVQSNAIAATCANIPIDRAGRLEVWSATGEGVRSEQWSYLRQRYIPYNSGNAVWERELTRGENNVWNYYDWWQSSLTPAASEKVYSKAAMTISLSANTVLGAVNTYTRIPFDRNALSTNSRLTLDSNSIRIGANIQYVKVSGQVLVSPGSTNGLRHIRIQKVSGGTTSSVAWNTIYVTASHHTIFVMTPVIVSVKEGDLLNMVFYTGNSSDSISSGTTANGLQTYLTVEEL